MSDEDDNEDKDKDEEPDDDEVEDDPDPGRNWRVKPQMEGTDQWYISSRLNTPKSYLCRSWDYSNDGYHEVLLATTERDVAESIVEYLNNVHPAGDHSAFFLPDSGNEPWATEPKTIRFRCSKALQHELQDYLFGIKRSKAP